MRKKSEPKKIYVASSRRVMLVLMSLSTIYQYMVHQPLFQRAGHAAGIRRRHVHERAHGGRLLPTPFWATAASI